MGLKTKLFMGPFASYLILMFYAAIMSTFIGYAWIKEHRVLVTEYIVIVQMYYLVCLFGPTFRNRKKDVA